jgi:hypothetical protein
MCREISHFRKSGIAISGVTKEVGNFHGKSPGNDLSCPSVGTRGQDREPIDISGFGVSRILRTYVFRHWKVRNPDRRYDCGHIRGGHVNHESSPEG